ncbi:hypothetical protein FOA52_012879 [Chlamydomonas sp. UWO 241]|nr:hypothetical protein FOA52_012879 [Chlamydomonas sp. UWO 241]
MLSLARTVPGIFNLPNAMAVANHVLLIQQMREMVQAIMRVDIQDMADLVDDVVDVARARLDPHSREPVPNFEPLGVAQVFAVKAVLKVVEGFNFFEHEADVSAGGQAAVITLRMSVFGGPETFNGLDALGLGSMENFHTFHSCCLQLLVHCLRPSNSLRLMRLGRAIALPQLEDEAMLFALVNMAEVLDGPGIDEWTCLEADTVASILSSSHVRLPGGELGVWDALSAWVGFSPHERKPLVPRLLSYCLRLDEMDALQLQQLRQTPMCAGVPEAASAVSAAYTRKIVSSVHGSRPTPEHGSGGGRMGGMGGTHPGRTTLPSLSMWLPGGDGASSPVPSTISPEEMQLLKRPRRNQDGIAAAVVGPEVVSRVDGQAAAGGGLSNQPAHG